MSWGLEKLYRGETAPGERAPYFDRRKATLGFTKSTGFCFALLPLAFLAAGSVGVASTFSWPCSRFVPPGLLLILGILRRQSLAYFGIVSRSGSYKLLVSQTFLGQVVVYDVPRGIRHVGS